MLGRNGNIAYVRYDSHGRIVPGGPIISPYRPKVGNWQPVSNVIGTSVTSSSLRAFVRIDYANRVVPSSLLLLSKAPDAADSGTSWLEINATYIPYVPTTTTTTSSTTAVPTTSTTTSTSSTTTSTSTSTTTSTTSTTTTVASTTTSTTTTQAPTTTTTTTLVYKTFNFYPGISGDSGTSCALPDTYSSTWYFTGPGTYPTVGDTIYSSPGNIYALNNSWVKIANGHSLQGNSSGVITQDVVCPV